MATCVTIKEEAEPDVESELDAQHRAFAEKILAIQRLDLAQIAGEAPRTRSNKQRQKPGGFRVAKVSTRRHFGDFEPEPTEEEKRRARARLLIARTLRQASVDQRRRRRKVKIFPLLVRSFSPLVTYLRWIRNQPWLRWARMQLRKQYSTSRVTSSPPPNETIGVPLLPLALEGEWQHFD